jgi:hypothetical protein
VRINLFDTETDKHPTFFVGQSFKSTDPSLTIAKLGRKYFTTKDIQQTPIFSTDSNIVDPSNTAPKTKFQFRMGSKNLPTVYPGNFIKEKKDLMGEKDRQQLVKKNLIFVLFFFKFFHSWK